MSTVAGPLHVSSLLRTMALAPPSRDRHHAARQLASLDPRQFLANLQLAAANRSPHAIEALKADMYELNDIFHKLSRAGHDVSAAQRDFQMLQTFVSQLSNSTPSQSEKQRHTSHHHQHHRTASVPSSSPSLNPMALSSRPRSNEHNYSSTRQGQQYQHQAQAPNTGSSRSTSRHPPSSAPSSSSTSSSRSNSNINANTTVWSPTPHRLIKPRRASVPVDSSSASTKKVHFATHATVYTFNSERGRSASSPGVIDPPSRPACVPRVDGRFSADGRPRF